MARPVRATFFVPPCWPGMVNAFEQAMTLHQQGQLEKAEALYRQLLDADASDANALHFLGLLCHQCERDTEALDLLGRARQLVPDYPDTWAVMALCHKTLGRVDDGIAACEQALDRNPRHPMALNLRGYFAHLRGEWSQAIGFYNRAVQADPRHADAIHNLGITLHYMGQPDRAAQCYQRALALNPDSAQLHYNLALAQQVLGQHADSKASLRRALELEPDHVEAFYRLGYLKRLTCDWDALDDYTRKLDHRLREYLEGGGNEPLSPYVANLFEIDPDTHRGVARRYGELIEQTARGVSVEMGTAPAKDRLRVGYLSPDLGRHAIGMLVRDLFGAHDRDNFEIFVYSLRDDPHPNLAHVRATSDVFRDLSGASWAQAARTIADDGINILVDLAGYTQSSRPEILAMRPAPIQVSWLGYLNTMGASFIDYIVADGIVIPPDDDALYDEAVIRLPPSFLLGSPVEPAADVPSRADLGLPEEGVVYSSFNNGYKLDPALFDVWMEVLASVDDSVLWIYAGAAAVENLRAEVAARGMHGQRLVFAEGIRLEDHLARQVHADVFLDAFQYSAGATGVAALMAGVPLLTLYGDRMLSRMGASLNHAMGMSELVCTDRERYRETAVRIGTDAAYRQGLRERMGAARKNSSLFQPRRFARRLEQAYRVVWARHEAGEKPGSVDISEE